MSATIGLVEPVYRPLRHSRSRFLTVRGVRYHLREWGSVTSPPLVLVHGARDTSASFQFVVDSLAAEWHVLAPDWRGHGQSGWTPGSYWLADFLCDLDALLFELFQSHPVPLVGHSMGSNISAAYAGLRPHRVARLVMLDSMGNPLDRSPVRMAETLMQLLDSEAATPRFQSYESQAQMSARLLRANRRLDPARAAFLGAGNSRPLADGGFAWAWDPAFRKSWPTFHDTDEWAECWSRIQSPVLCLLSSDPRQNAATAVPEAVAERSRHFRNISLRRIPETGHNVHVDAPQVVASSIEEFLR